MCSWTGRLVELKLKYHKNCSINTYFKTSEIRCIFYVFTTEIIDPGEKCTIGIGICPGKTYPANRMPGWNRWSIAYHADDGG